MPRLGEILIADGLVSADQVEQALRAQVVWGGRLGTNLVELHCIDLDGVAAAIGKQRGLPAALARHFEAADPAVQAQLPALIAARWACVPLRRFGEDARLAIAAIDPLGAEARVVIAETYGIDPALVVVALAAELRIKYHLEAVYKIQRPARFLRSRGQSIPPFPLFEADAISEADDELSIPITIDEDDEPSAPVEPAEPLDIDLAGLADEASQPSVQPAGRDRRRYVPTLGEAEDVAPEAALGRIAIRRVAVVPRTASEALDGDEPLTLDTATRAIRRSKDRDKVAELVIEAIEQFAPTCEAAVLLVVRGGVATGWKAFSRSDSATAEISVPLDQPGLVPKAIEANAVIRAHASDLSPIDRLLLAALDRADGDLAVAPVAIASRVLCAIAVATSRDADLGPLDAIVTACGTAFARLIRDASR